MNSKLLREGLNQIKERYGIVVLHDERKTIALFADLVPNAKIERSALKNVYDSGAMRILLSATESSDNAEFSILRAVDTLKNNALMDRRIAECLVEEICFVIGIKRANTQRQDNYCVEKNSNVDVQLPSCSPHDVRRDRLVCHLNSTYAFTKMGKVLCAGVADYEKQIYSSWEKVDSISKSGSIAVRTDGTVIYNDSYKSGFEALKFKAQLNKWRDVIKVCSSLCNLTVIGLKKDGSLIGYSWDRLSKVEKSFLETVEVVDIVNYDSSFAALKKDGTVVCLSFDTRYKDVAKNWRDIIKIELTLPAIIGLGRSGEVFVQDYKIPNWDGVVDFCCNDFCSNYVSILGLRNDGKVLSCGVSTDSKFFLPVFYGVNDWNDIISISGGKDHAVGLKKDGSVVACGKNDHGQCLVDSWRDIVQIACGENHTVGLRKDGTVVACGNNEYGQCDVDKWNLFN